jgi:hypothetical protein
MDNPDKLISLLEFLIKKRQRNQGCNSFVDPIRVRIGDVTNGTQISDKADLLDQVESLKSFTIQLDGQNMAPIYRIDIEPMSSRRSQTNIDTGDQIALIHCQTKFMEMAIKDLRRQKAREGRVLVKIGHNSIERVSQDGTRTHQPPYTPTGSRMKIIKKLAQSPEPIRALDLYEGAAKMANRWAALRSQIESINTAAGNKLGIEVDLIIHRDKAYSLNRESIEFTI